MKKFTLIAAAMLAAVSANAQYEVYGDDMYVEATQKVAGATKYWTVFVNDAYASKLTNAEYIGPNDAIRPFYYWEGTFMPGDDSFPGIGWNEDEAVGGYVSLNVQNVGWSGAGIAQLEGTTVDTSSWDDETRFRIAYRSTLPAPAVVGINLFNVAKFGLGGDYNDNGAIWPAVGSTQITDEWVVCDFALSELAKISAGTGFTLESIKNAANAEQVLVVLAGGVNGTNICLSSTFFYQPKAGFDGFSHEKPAGGVDNAAIDVNAPVQYFNLNGMAVNADNLTKGIYVAKQGNKASKFIVK